MHKLSEYIESPLLVWKAFENRGLLNWMPSRQYLLIRYYLYMNKRCDLNCPVTFSEKLQWLKLNNKNPLYTKLVDKYSAKEYVAKTLGKEYIVPTIGVWDNIDEVDFDELPDRFVLKCTHDSGGIVICKDKTVFSINNARMRLKKSLEKNYYWLGREWP